MKPVKIAMDQATFEKAWALGLKEPDIGTLVARFTWARDQAGSDAEAAMAAVNEVLLAPLTLDEFIDRIVSAA